MNTAEAKQLTIEPVPADMPGDKLEVAAMIVEAARRLCASLTWTKSRMHGAWYANVCGLTDDEEVAIEPCAKFRRALIESDDGDRRSYYETVDALVTTVRGRFARQRAAAKRDAEARVESRRRDAASLACRQAATAQLVEAFDQELVDACMYVTDYFAKDATEPRARVNVHVHVHVGSRILGENLSVAAAVRFTQAMLSAGYDLVKLSAEAETAAQKGSA